MHRGQDDPIPPKQVAMLADAWLLDRTIRTWLVARMALPSAMATGTDEGAKALVPLIKDHRMRPMRWSCFDTTVIHREGHSHTMSLFITFVQGKCDPSWVTRCILVQAVNPL